MQYTTFAAIDIGSYELSMKIFELSSKMGMREIDHIRRRIELGMDTYRSGRISHDLVEELCEVLQDFKRIMGEYKMCIRDRSSTFGSLTMARAMATRCC